MNLFTVRLPDSSYVEVKTKVYKRSLNELIKSGMTRDKAHDVIGSRVYKAYTIMINEMIRKERTKLLKVKKIIYATGFLSEKEDIEKLLLGFGGADQLRVVARIVNRIKNQPDIYKLSTKETTGMKALDDKLTEMLMRPWKSWKNMDGLI